MNKIIFTCFIHFLICTKAFGLDVSVNTACFYTTDKPYIEIYSKFFDEGLQWIVPFEDQDFVQANIEFLCLIQSAEKMVIAEKYVLNSPSSTEAFDFWDMRRFSLDPGEYELQLQFVDLNNTRDTFNFRKRIEIEERPEEAFLSDILLCAKVGDIQDSLAFSKSNFQFEPLHYNLVEASKNKLLFYAEVYNLMMESQACFVKYYIENTEADGFDRFSKSGYKKLATEQTQQLLVELDAAELESGNYILHLELNHKDQSLVDRVECRFAVYNPLKDLKNSYNSDRTYSRSFVQLLSEAELDYSLRAIYPRVGNNMSELLNIIIAGDDLEPKKYFLYNFWSKFSMDNMKKLYEQYMDVARAVDNTYATNVGYGFETPRGYFFLKYGKPDDIVFEEDEQTAPPYEIWIYNYVEETQQTNVKFLFYNPSLSHNDFILLHSTCRGERNNPRWELDLYSDAYIEQPSNYIDGRQMPSNFNRNARRYFYDY